MSALETYIPGFQADILKAPINMASHFQVLAGLKTSKPESKSRQVNPLEPVPAFNTNNGKTSKPPIVDVIPEVCQDSISVMQYLNIGGRSVLCLFDRGANQHLIEGHIAEEIGMKVVSKEPSAIGIVSGDRIWTEYGKYKMLLGPTSSGNYFELIAQGITAVTGKFPKYDLTAANKEAQQSTDLHPGTQLPPYIGNERVGLIIGLKCPEIEPTCVFTLPSGLGLYKSPFRDIFGSYYCYGGPHESFTEINNKFNGNINHFNIFFSQIINQYRNCLHQYSLILKEPDDYVNYCALSEYYNPNVLSSYQSGSGETKFPSPIVSQDFYVVEKPIIDERSPTKMICSSQHSQYSISSLNHSSAFKWGMGSVAMIDHLNLCINKSWIVMSRVVCAVLLIVHLMSTILITSFNNSSFNRFKHGCSNYIAIGRPLYPKYISGPSKLLKEIQCGCYWFQLLFGWIHQLFVRPMGMDFTNEFKSKDNDSLKLLKWNFGLVVEIQKAEQGYIFSYPGIPSGYNEAELKDLSFRILRAGRGDPIVYPSIPTGFKEADKMGMRFGVLKAGRGDFISYPSIPAGFKEADILKM